MSYILDALRKSETERRQGKVPDLGQQVQLIHHPKKRRLSPVVWVALALLVNAGVLAVVFWPNSALQLRMATDAQKTATEPAPTSVPASKPILNAPEDVQAESQTPGTEPVLANPVDSPEKNGVVTQQLEPEGRPADPVTEAVRERPVVITPSARRERPVPEAPQEAYRTRVPHLVELPLSFQKSIPDLMFNSHIYSTDPYASRVMINGHYLRPGESFEGITVEEVTEDGVVLSKQGKTFRVGIVRDWVSPR